MTEVVQYKILEYRYSNANDFSFIIMGKKMGAFYHGISAGNHEQKYGDFSGTICL